MNSRDKKLVFAGVLVGLLLALSAGAFFSRQTSAKAATQGHEGMAMDNRRDESMNAEIGTTPGTAVQLDPDEINAAGVQTVKVTSARLKSSVDAVGRVEQPEAQLATIPSRVGGRIDKLYVQFTGETIRRGAPVAEIYSPELVASAEEYRLAIENRDRMSRSSEMDAVSNAERLVEASRRRLELWGLSNQQIEAAAHGNAGVHATIYASAEGTVVERKVTRGQYVSSGDALFTVADLGTVWVKADVYEFQLPQIRPGQAVKISSDAFPEQMLKGRVDFVEPEANAQTRTIPVHIHVPNPGMKLRPGMYIRASFESPAEKETIVVPRSAVLDTGNRKLVYVAKPDGVFEAREIQAGAPTEELYPVLSGLSAGEQVVTNGNFLIDSQTRLTGGMSGMFGGSKEYGNGKSAGTATAATSQPTAKISLMVEPNPPKGAADNMFHVSLTDASGKSIPGAQVTVTLVMPAMPSMSMPEMRNSFTLPYAQGMYMGKGNVGMAGSWNVLVEAKVGGQIVATYRTHFNAE